MEHSFRIEGGVGIVKKEIQQTIHEKMARKKNKRVRKQVSSGTIFVSPDGGETVYEQKRGGGWGRCVYQSEQSKLMDQAQAEMSMMGTEAIRMRRKYPALQKAWDQYKLLWNVIVKDEYDY
jgi:hypothetical protein